MGEMLVTFLMEVFDVCRNAELVVVNMVANNVKTLKQLPFSEKTPFFRFYDQEIAAAFDSRHLLKCTCNMFLKHDVMRVGFEDGNCERLTGTPKWEDILKVYEIDKQNVLYYLLTNVTDN